MSAGRDGLGRNQAVILRDRFLGHGNGSSLEGSAGNLPQFLSSTRQAGRVNRSRTPRHFFACCSQHVRDRPVWIG